MFGLLIRISFVILVCNIILIECGGSGRGGRGSGSGKTSKVNKGYVGNAGGTSQDVPTPQHTRRGLGLSAWGIVALTVSLILAGMGLYYAVTCYPIICQKQSSYNMMGMTPV